jgi:enoyl-CoA hydratase/carnithine racemase
MDEVLFERIGDHIALVTLNRPAQRNAVNGAIARAMDGYVAQIEADKSIRAAILYSSSERAFCAGADLAEFAAGRGHDLNTKNGGFAGFAYAKRQKPWIAAVRGYALGGGLELCLACEMIVAGEGASFGLPEVKRGIAAGAGGAYRLPRVIPKAIAFEMLATGEPVTAARAYELGLVNRVVPKEEVLAEATRLATSIAANAPMSVRESLGVARASADLAEPELQHLLDEAFARLMASPDAQEGPRAFVEKRAPLWQG